MLRARLQTPPHARAGRVNSGPLPLHTMAHDDARRPRVRSRLSMLPPSLRGKERALAVSGGRSNVNIYQQPREGDDWPGGRAVRFQCETVAVRRLGRWRATGG